MGCPRFRLTILSISETSIDGKAPKLRNAFGWIMYAPVYLFTLSIFKITPSRSYITIVRCGNIKYRVYLILNL